LNWVVEGTTADALNGVMVTPVTPGYVASRLMLLLIVTVQLRPDTEVHGGFTQLNGLVLAELPSHHAINAPELLSEACAVIVTVVPGL
jgi:hypothetical protein